MNKDTVVFSADRRLALFQGVRYTFVESTDVPRDAYEAAAFRKGLCRKCCFCSGKPLIKCDAYMIRGFRSPGCRPWLDVAGGGARKGVCGWWTKEV